jgi:hypothetical protein
MTEINEAMFPLTHPIISYIKKYTAADIVKGCGGLSNHRHHYLKGYSLPPLWTTPRHINNI